MHAAFARPACPCPCLCYMQPCASRLQKSLLAARHKAYSSSKQFSSSQDGLYSIAILGDLHLEPAQMHLFEQARQQLVAAMSDAGAVLPGARVVQLGDLGGYAHRPGSRDCFTTALEYLNGFDVPVSLILGNHDLEGEEFECDSANLAAWQEAFGQNHYWAENLGPVLAVGLSTVRFRSNKYSVHEVYIDDEQMDWFEGILTANTHRPIAVFTHAPPMGSGLKVVANVHVKNRCAWLNHSDRPQRFIRLVERYPNIKLWFSGHFHLSQNYADSISVVGSCAFVQTGVIGECNRDGNRQSRFVRFDSGGYQLFTVDHNDDGRLRLDLQQDWNCATPPRPVTPDSELICDPSSGWLCSQLDCQVVSAVEGGAAGDGATGVQWLPAGPNCLLAVQDDLLVEYDLEMRSPAGVVAFLQGRQVSLVAADGRPPQADDGSDAVAVLLRDLETEEVARLERNEQGSFFRIFQPNKWVLKKQQAQAAAAAQEKSSVVVAAHS